MCKKFTHQEIFQKFRRGLRNGNWRKLNRLEKALYRASMWYARAQGEIVNDLVVNKLSVLMDRLVETVGTRIFRHGLKRAEKMSDICEKNRVFEWAPSLRAWLKDPDYIFYLGRSE